jgi:two-component system chemotaxis response regulator CheB
MKRIRVLIVDDSALVRRALTQSLGQHEDIEVVGTAVDPYAARDKILSLNPDVLTLDIEMPRMDGLTFLKLLMKHRPMPVVIMSSLTAAGSAKALEALQAGAVEVLEKPSNSDSTYEDACRLAEVVRAASHARLRSTGDAAPPRPAPAPPRLPRRTHSSRQIVLMGASTGGTEALKAVLTSLGPDVPGICIVQHIPAQFSLAFANRLNSLCAFEVREARSGDRVMPGLALVAPGGFHMVLRSRGTDYEVQLSEGPRIHYQRPAVDVLFESAVKAGAGAHALGILLTGMGADGAAGLLSLQSAGAETIAQDEQSCVVFGMPREAIRLGAAQSILPLGQIGPRIERFASRGVLAPA